MNKLTQKTRDFLRDEEGLAMVGYAVAGGLITVVAISAFQDLGESIRRVTEAINTRQRLLSSGG